MAVFHLGITECHDKVVTLRRAAGKQNEPRKKKKKKKESGIETLSHPEAPGYSCNPDTQVS
jgi:hypothetical protein